MPTHLEPKKEYTVEIFSVPFELHELYQSMNALDIKFLEITSKHPSSRIHTAYNPVKHPFICEPCKEFPFFFFKSKSTPKDILLAINPYAKKSNIYASFSFITSKYVIIATNSLNLIREALTTIEYPIDPRCQTAKHALRKPVLILYCKPPFLENVYAIDRLRSTIKDISSSFNVSQIHMPDDLGEPYDIPIS